MEKKNICIYTAHFIKLAKIQFTNILDLSKVLWTISKLNPFLEILHNNLFLLSTPIITGQMRSPQMATTVQAYYLTVRRIQASGLQGDAHRRKTLFVR